MGNQVTVDSGGSGSTSVSLTGTGASAITSIPATGATSKFYDIHHVIKFALFDCFIAC
jgi:hypothetical protein